MTLIDRWESEDVFYMARRLVLATTLLILVQGLVFAQTEVNIEFYGTIQSANSTAIVINGQIVDVQGVVVNAPLATGVTVRVQATVLPDGSLAARQIEVLPAGVIPGIVEINGVVTDFVLPFLTVNGQVIDITGTEISGTVAIGQSVRIFAVSTAPGVWQARFVDAGDAVTTPPVVLVPATTPEVLPPATTPEVSDDDDDHADDNGDDNGDDDHADDDGDDNGDDD
jgi:hypothetical protein